MRKFLTLIAAMAFFPAAFAQVTAGSGSTATAQTAPIYIEGAQSTDRLKTVGAVMLPGNAVSSGGFNCGGTGGVGVAGMGFSAGASGSKSLQDCVRLNLLSFAAAAKDQAMYEAVWCTIPAGREAVIEMGADCPSDRRAGRRTTSSAPVAANPLYAPQ